MHDAARSFVIFLALVGILAASSCISGSKVVGSHAIQPGATSFQFTVRGGADLAGNARLSKAINVIIMRRNGDGLSESDLIEDCTITLHSEKEVYCRVATRTLRVDGDLNNLVARDSREEELSPGVPVVAYTGPIGRAGFSLRDLPDGRNTLRIAVTIPEQLLNQGIKVELVHMWADGP